MHKIKLILLLILPLSVLGQDLGIIDTKTTKNPAINGTHRISTDGKNLFFRNFFGLSRKVANTDSAVFTNGIKVNSGVNNVEIDQTQIMFRRTNGTTMTLGNYRAYSHQFFTNASFSGLTQAMSINNYGQVIVGNQILDGISNPTVKFQVGATGEARQRIISQASNATIELNGATGGNISNTTGNLNYTSAGNHVFNSKVILPDSTSIGNISSTELTYLDGVTSPIQTQLNNKAPITSPTFITDATTPRLKITGAGDVGKGSDLVMAGNSNDLTMHGTGKVILGTGGFQRLVVTNAGNVGVGTTAPVAKFEVSGLAGFRYNDGKQADGKYLRSNSTGVAAWDSVKVSEVFGLNTTYLPISNPTSTGTLTAPTIANSLGATFATSSGNVGIGTTSPSQKLSVLVSTGTAIPTVGSAGGHQILSNGTYGMMFGVNNSGNGWIQASRTDATATNYNLLLNPNGGNVGIGTTSPTSKLHIEGDNSSTTDETVLTLRGNGENGKRIDFRNAFGSLSRITGTKLAAGASADDGILTFETSTNSILSEKMRITDLGNVGIGTTSPNAPLQFANNTVNRKIVLYENTNNDHDFYGFGVNSGVLRYQTGIGTNHVFYVGATSTTSNELMRIQSNGNVGIGTPTPVAKLDVAGNVFASGNNPIVGGTTGVGIGTTGGYPQISLRDNAGVTDTKTWDTYAAGTIMYSRVVNDANSSAQVWQQVQRSGATVSLVSFPNGNVGIGTTTPNAKLHVFSAAAFNRMQVENNGNFHNGLRLNRTGGDYATDWEIYTPSNSTALNFFNGSNRMTMFANGRVGIGTTVDAGYLTDINGTLRTANSAYFATTSGNVGIGTTAPVAKLTVVGSDNAISMDAGVGGNPYLDFQQNGVQKGYLQYVNSGAYMRLVDAGIVGLVQKDGKIGIGTTTPNASSVLDITSTTKGVLFPRMTTTEISAIASPADGLTVYNTTLKAICFYDSSAAVWKRVSHSNM